MKKFLSISPSSRSIFLPLETLNTSAKCILSLLWSQMYNPWARRPEWNLPTMLFRATQNEGTTSVTVNLALRAGSSQQGKQRRAHVAQSWLTAMYLSSPVALLVPKNTKLSFPVTAQGYCMGLIILEFLDFRCAKSFFFFLSFCFPFLSIMKHTPWISVKSWGTPRVWSFTINAFMQLFGHVFFFFYWCNHIQNMEIFY